MTGSGYKAQTTEITGNTTGMSEESLKRVTTQAVAKSSGADEVKLGVGGGDFDCVVDTKKLKEMAAQLREDEYTCKNTLDANRAYTAKVRHGQITPK